MWTEEESRLSINILEMKVVILGVQASQSTLRGKCVTLFPDNSTIIAYFWRRGDCTFGHFVPIDVGPVSALV
jgi:hypothetical protein